MPLSTFISRSINSHRESLTDICRVIYRIFTRRIEVKSISDIISLVNKINNATEIEWDIDNEKVSISFKNEDINNSLKDYALDYRCKDINIENESSDSEATLTRLMLINNSLK